MKKLVFTLLLMAGVVISAQAQVVAQQRPNRQVRERHMIDLQERRKHRRMRRHRRRMFIMAYPAIQHEMVMARASANTVSI